MLLDAQTQFREDYLVPIMNDEEVEMPPGYQEKYDKWVAVNAEVLPRLGAEERAQSFSDYLQEEVKRDIDALIKAKLATPEKKRELRQLAARGQVLLASNDGGKTFDQLITLDDIGKVSAEDYYVLSSTFRSSTTNLTEVLDEQSLLHITAKLKDQHYLVNRAWLEDHTVHVDVVHPRRGTQEVQVDLTQPVNKPLEYQFTGAEGIKVVPETQLPEEFGELPEEPALFVPPTETLIAGEVLTAGPKPSVYDPVNAAAAATAAANAAKAANAANAGVLAAAAMQAQAQAAMAAPLQAAKISAFANAMAAQTAAMKARFARQMAAIEEAQRREAERKAKQEEELRAQGELKEQQAAEAAAKAKKGKKRLVRGGILGGVLGGGLLAGAAGAATFITNINLML